MFSWALIIAFSCLGSLDHSINPNSPSCPEFQFGFGSKAWKFANRRIGSHASASVDALDTKEAATTDGKLKTNYPKQFFSSHFVTNKKVHFVSVLY